jgi:hypothetical protein
MAAGAPTRKGIKDVFYETRVLMGRDYTLRRFASEVLGNSIDPVMLGYIEKGKRFPNEALVRRLAAVRHQDAHELLVLLWRDRILYAFGRELKRVLHAPRAVAGVEDAELAVLVSQAIAALPDDESWIPVATWRKAFRSTRSSRRPAEAQKVSDALAARVEQSLLERRLVERRAGKVRRRGRHYVPQNVEERRALALEFCALFAKGLLDKLALPDVDTGTYLRNHYLNIDPARLPEFQRRLEAALRALAEEFAGEPSRDSRFLNVLITATPF